MRIIVNPDQLRDLAKQLTHSGNELHAISDNLSHVLSYLDWEVRQKANVDAQVSTACAEANPLVAQTESMARFLTAKAQAFEEADGQGVANLGQVSNIYTELIAQLIRYAPWVGLPLTEVARQLNLGKLLAPLDQGVFPLTTIPPALGKFFEGGKEAWDDAFEWLQGAGVTAVRSNDRWMDSMLSQLLPQSLPNSGETLRFNLKGNVTIPGIEVGIPGSFKGVGAGSAAITRNANGTYTLTLSSEGGAGLREDAIKAKGSLKLGKDKLTVGIDAGAEAIGKGIAEVSYVFDPKVSGDLTKMEAFMATTGVATVSGAGNVLAGPTLMALKDNLNSVKISGGLEGGANADASALFKVAGVEIRGAGLTGGSLTKSEDGHWQIAQHVELDGSVDGKVLTLKEGLSGKTTLEQIVDAQTGKQSARVILELIAEQDSDRLNLAHIEDYVPKSALHSLQVNAGSQYEKVIIEYTLDEPIESIKQAFLSGDGPPNFRAIAANSTVRVDGMLGTESGLGVGGEVGAATQSIGFEVEGNIQRESKITVHSSER